MAIIEMRLPEYTCTLPISKVDVKFRPFTVKEEKILLLAQEENKIEVILTAINQIFNNCTGGKISIDKLNKIDAEYLFVQLRNKSMGEGVNIRGICEQCNKKTPMTLDLSLVKVKGELNSKPIELLENVFVTLKVPTLTDSMKIKETDDILAIALSLDTIIEGDTIKVASDYSLEDRIEFVESLMSTQIVKLGDYYKDFPRLYMDINYTCECGHENNIHIEGIENFFG